MHLQGHVYEVISNWYDEKMLAVLHIQVECIRLAMLSFTLSARSLTQVETADFESEVILNKNVKIVLVYAVSYAITSFIFSNIVDRLSYR